MTNSVKLRAAVRRSGLRYGYIANRLKISAYCLAQKIDNRTEFRASEILHLSKLLNLTKEERDEIFFAENVE